MSYCSVLDKKITYISYILGTLNGVCTGIMKMLSVYNCWQLLLLKPHTKSTRRTHCVDTLLLHDGSADSGPKCTAPMPPAGNVDDLYEEFDDPDDLDEVYSAGDTLTLSLDGGLPSLASVCAWVADRNL